jgi:hypothetical protein
MTQSTEQRLTLYVPDPVVPTSLSLGAAWNGSPPDAGTAWNGRGLCVNSAGRVWLDANGEESTSTFGALSNDPDGQLLFQSISAAVLCISKESNVVSSNASVFLAAGGGIKMVAGHGAPLLFGLGDNSVVNVRPDETSPASDHAAAYTDHLDAVSKGWVIADTVVAATLTALDVALMIAECAKGSKWPSMDLGMGLLIAGSAANLAAGGVNIAGMQGSDLPGINMHAYGNINFATTGFCSMYAGGGMLMFGATAGGLGFATASVIGFVNAGVKSVLLTGTEGKNASLTASTTLELNARSALWEFSGPQVQVGANEFADVMFAKTQLRTMRIDAESSLDFDVSAGLAGSLSIDSKGTSTYEGGVIDVDAGTGLKIRGPEYEVAIAMDKIEIKLLQTTKIAVKPDSVMFDATGAQALKLDATSVKLGGKGASLKIDATGSVVWTTPLANFL